MDIITLVELIISGISRGMIYALMTVGLALILGILNIPNFAQGEFYMIGAYIAWFILGVLHLGPVIALLSAALVTFVVGVCCEKMLFTPLRKFGGRGWLLNVFILTLGLSLILQNTALVTIGPLYYGAPYVWSPNPVILFGLFRISYDRLMIIIVGGATILALWIFLKKSKLGRAIRAVAQESTAASLMGVNLKNVYTFTFGLGCMLSGIAGALTISILPAYPTVGIIPLYKAWFVIIMAGLGTMGACIPIGILLGIVETLGVALASEGWQNVIYLVIICILLIFRPFGIFGKGEVRGIWER
ncbi:MAG: branched-chain amino acid ABC transporter permease [Candidatus Bathyarchaeia archaeon]|nr:branched-chain amino acid ABC transporter permease [Candidatus Bathyarchaeota archaeon]